MASTAAKNKCAKERDPWPAQGTANTATDVPTTNAATSMQMTSTALNDLSRISWSSFSILGVNVPIPNKAVNITIIEANTL
ncbi:MAG TPA: hypothetical protein VH370_15810 [Humisphaera sp.]|nr:hypothetical protein [Humisphaera sp.]